MRWLLALCLVALSSIDAGAQQNQCRTAPVGTSTPYCASEAFVTETAAAIPPGVTSIDSTAGAFTIGGLLSRASNLLQVLAGTRAQQQAATSNVVAVTPLHQQDHDSAAKAIVKFTGSAVNGAQTLNFSYNVTSVTRTGTGIYVVSVASPSTPFSSADYACAPPANNGGTTDGWGEYITQTPNAITAIFISKAGALFDPVNGAYIVCFGRQ